MASTPRPVKRSHPAARKRSKVAPTLQEIARHAKVSVMTVSNFVNGRHRQMSAETRARIEGVIARLGYRRRSDGLSLRGSRRYAVAMLIVDPSPTFLADPFITHLVAGLSNGLSERGYNLVLARTQPDHLKDSLVIRNRGTDGLCLMLSGSAAARRRCIEHVTALGEPVVIFQEPKAAEFADMLLVRQDDRGGAGELARRVLATGARELLMLVPRLTWPAIEERVRGVRDAIRKWPQPVAFATLECGDEHYPETQAALDAYAKKHGLPQAILAGNDQMGIAALKWLRSRRIKVPKDIRLTGFNAFEFWQYTTPLLTTARSAAYDMGRCAAAEMLVRIEQGAFSRREIVFPVTMVPGETC
jgi:LacI family transcriptional regulator